MKHKPTYQPETKTRESIPRVKETAKEVMLLCPFCPVPHPIAVGKAAPCGTTVQVKAVQTFIPIRTVNKRKLTCFKCGKSGGEMVPFNQGYLHLIDCMPGTHVLAEPPAEFSRLAAWVHGLPADVRGRVEKLTGESKKIEEIDPQGKVTGRVLGYIFHKGGA